MATIVDRLIETFTHPEGDTTPAALAQQVRDEVNSDVNGDIDLSDELKVARERFNDLYNGGEFDPRHAPDMRMLSQIFSAIEAVDAEQKEARAELDAEFSSTAAEMSGASAPAPEETPSQATEEPETAFSDADQGDAPEGAPEAAEGEQAPQEPAPAEPETRFKVRPAAAPVRLPGAGDINSHRTGGAGNTGAAAHVRRRYSITAAADVPRVTPGSSLSMRELAEATINRFQAMPVGQRVVGSRRGAIALVKRTFDQSLTTYNDQRDQRVIDNVADERNLPGGSLVAAAQSHRQALTAAGCCTGMSNDIWCAPSETDYTLCEPLSTLEGMVDLPTIPVNRGGIRYPVWTQLPFDWHGTVVENSCDTPIAPDHFETEANYKTCISGPCPEWQEVRMSLQYLCVEGDILRERAYPELTQRFINDAMVAHAHYMNHTYLAHIYENSDTIPGFDVSAGGIGSVSDSVVDRLGLLISWFRERYKLGINTTLEGIAPVWFREYIKLDLARKNNRPFTSVTNAEVEDLFAAYTTRIQWVYDTEGITADASLQDGTAVDGRPMPGTWPSNVEMVFFPAGSWVLGQQEIISLDALYDSEKLKRNKYTALFFEEGFLLLNRCNRSFRVRLTNLCRSGGVGEPVTVGCPENPAPPETATAATAPASGDSESTGESTQRSRRRAA